MKANTVSRSTLLRAVKIIKQWHDMLDKNPEDSVFKIYYEHAPEMKQIRDVLGDYDEMKLLKRLLFLLTPNKNNMEAKEIQAVIDWMNEWEQLKDTSIPMRFKEDFKPSSAVVGAKEFYKEYSKITRLYEGNKDMICTFNELIDFAEAYAQSSNATKLPSITEIEIKSMAEDKYPSCEEWDEGACEGFQVGYKLGLLKSGLKEREGEQHISTKQQMEDAMNKDQTRTQ